jgi:hypothetical protein
MAQINPRTFADAKQLADGVYELILTNWGNRGQAQDPDNGSIIFPPVAGDPNTGIIPSVPFPAGVPDPLVRGTPIPSVAAIAISPRSIVDRCILQIDGLPQIKQQFAYANNQKQVTEDPDVIRHGGMLETELQLAVGAPYIGQINGPVVVRADSAHWYRDTYNRLPANGGGAPPFGSALGRPGPSDFGGSPNVFISPELRLLLYLTGTPTPLPPQRRAPLRLSWLMSFGVISPPSPLILLRAVPIMGRRHISIAISTDPFSKGGELRFTGLVSSVLVSSSLSSNHVNDEIDLGISPILLSGGSESFYVNVTNEAPVLSWLLIYGKHTGGGTGTVLGSITVEAIDG